MNAVLRRTMMLVDGVGVTYLCGGALVAHLHPALARVHAHAVPTQIKTVAGLSAYKDYLGAMLTGYEHVLTSKAVLGDTVVDFLAFGLVCGMLMLLGSFKGQGRAAREQTVKVKEMREKMEITALATSGKPLEKDAHLPLVASATDLKAEGWLRSEGGWPVGPDLVSKKMVYVPRARQAEHTLVVGGTGSGKSSRVLLPWLFAEAAQDPEDRASLIVVDPKAGGELTDTSAGYMARAGYRVLVFDPLSRGTLRYNALSEAHGSRALRGLVTQWCACATVGSEPAFWRDLTISILTGVAAHLRSEAGDAWKRVSMADVAAFLREHDMDEVTEKVIGNAAAHPEDAPLKEVASALANMQKTPALRSGAVTGLKLKIACLTDEAVIASMAAHDFTPEFWREFVETPTVLYVPIAMEDAASIRPLVVSFFSGAISALDALAGTGNEKLSRPVRLLIDEFANLGRVAGMSRIISTARSRDIGIVVATQSPGDIRRVYGTEADAISNNLLTHVVLSRSTPEALKKYAVSDFRIGLRELMEKDTALVQRSGDVPVRVHTAGWFTDKRVARTVKETRASVDKRVALAHQATFQEESGVAAMSQGAPLLVFPPQPLAREEEHGGILEAVVAGDTGGPSEEDGVESPHAEDDDDGSQVSAGNADDDLLAAWS